ncbi:transcription factor 20 isoform X2 [Denticeps clupeoides]|nr:transcription factor 20-like isoform X2 [Denticeps clupeoides]
MEPLNHTKMMAIQDSIPAALDLSLSCKKSHRNQSSAEALNLVKKPSWYAFNAESDGRTPGFADLRPDALIPPPETHAALRFSCGLSPRHQLNGHVPPPSRGCSVKIGKFVVPGTAHRSETASPAGRLKARVSALGGFSQTLQNTNQASGDSDTGGTGWTAAQNGSGTDVLSRGQEPGEGTLVHDRRYVLVSSSTHSKSALAEEPARPVTASPGDRENVSPDHDRATAVPCPLYAESISSDDSDVVEVPVTNVHSGRSQQSRQPALTETDPERRDSSPVKSQLSTSDTENGRRAKQPPGTTAKRRPRAKQAKASPGKAAAKRRRKRLRQSGSSSIFPPQEPEIKLKYASCREDKRDGRADAFTPYVHVELRDFPDCTVVNFHDEEEERLKKGRRRTRPAAVTGAVPGTTCHRLGRVAAESDAQDAQVCCLCGCSANSRGLGDLHGPYYPSKGPAAGVNGAWPARGSERWVHEDCGVWSTGVFLVKGRLYGLEEAVRLGRETACTGCHRAGATLGCFFKGCHSKYHYACALQSDCSMNEENFSMRCSKHKSKSFKGGRMKLKQAAGQAEPCC